VITARPHRTQAERSAETQVALLEATIDSLAEVGYGHTSTTEIVRRAGVSRGAQVHHYPTKSDLVVAAVEHLFASQERAFVDRFGELPVGERTLDRAIDLLWEIFSGPTYPAVLELIVAGRTDPELRVVMQAVGTRLGRTVAELFGELFPDLGGEPSAERLVGFAFAVLQGAAISGFGGFADPEDAVGVLRSLAGLTTPDLLPLVGEERP
jgi:AcrR family transcriptional regulator